MMGGLHGMVSDVRSGKGSVGRLLVDTGFAAELSAAVTTIRDAGNHLGDAGQAAEGLATSARTLVQDSTLQTRLQASMENIRKGTEAFSQDMEALKHNFLLRGYFRRQEKAARKQQEEAAKQAAAQTRRNGP